MILKLIKLYNIIELKYLMSEFKGYRCCWYNAENDDYRQGAIYALDAVIRRLERKIKDVKTNK